MASIQILEVSPTETPIEDLSSELSGNIFGGTCYDDTSYYDPYYYEDGYYVFKFDLGGGYYGKLVLDHESLIGLLDHLDLELKY